MNTQKTNNFNDFYSKFKDLPLWIREVVFIHLKKDLCEQITESYLNVIDEEDVFQLYIPKLTYKGKKELETREKNYPAPIYKFLTDATKEQPIIEIVINNFWTLEECSRYFTDCVDAELLLKPKSNIILGTVQYLSSKIRLGEYFTRIEKITIDQLNEGLKQQQQIQDSTGDKVGIAGVLMNMGFVTEQDIQAILKIKDESKKRFIFNMKIDSFESSSSTTDDDLISLKETNTRLLRENKILKDQLRKILNIKK